MPSFDIDVSRYATDYVANSIKNLGGNAGQEALIAALEIDCSAVVTVHIAGDAVDTKGDGYIKLTSSHPEAIDQIMGVAEDNFLEFIDKLGSESFSSYNGIDVIRTIRQGAIDEAYQDL